MNGVAMAIQNTGARLSGATGSRARDAAVDPRRSVLVNSLRQRYAVAELRRDAAAKQALFREGVYLNILPQEFIDPS